MYQSPDGLGQKVILPDEITRCQQQVISPTLRDFTNAADARNKGHLLENPLF